MSSLAVESPIPAHSGGSSGVFRSRNCFEEGPVRKTEPGIDVTRLLVVGTMRSADGTFVQRSRRTRDHLITHYHSPLKGLEAQSELIREIRTLYKLDEVLGQAYEDAVRGVARGRASCGAQGRSCRREGRYASLSMLRPELKLNNAVYLDEGLPNLWRMELLVENDELFNAAIYGNLAFFANAFLEQVNHSGGSATCQEPELELSAASGPKNKIVGNPVTRVEITAGEGDRHCRGTVFLKTCSIEPDLFASRLLAGSGVFLPQMRSVSYTMPDEREGQYGLILDASSGPGGGTAFPISRLDSLDRDAAAYVKLRLGDISKALGHAFEICRLRGIQDRHPLNTWLKISESGDISIALIDLDVVGCYPLDLIRYQMEYAARLSSIANCLLSSEITGASDEEGRIDTLRALARPFLEGAREAYLADRRRDANIAEEFDIYDGRPVGIFCREDNLRYFPRTEEGPVTYNALNGPGRQRMIAGGPNSGRFRFDAGMAWEYGYSAQRAIRPDDFWRAALSMAEGYTIRSIVY